MEKKKSRLSRWPGLTQSHRVCECKPEMGTLGLGFGKSPKGAPGSLEGTWRPSIPGPGGSASEEAASLEVSPTAVRPPHRPAYAGILGLPRGRRVSSCSQAPPSPPRLTSSAPWTQCTLLLPSAPLPQLLIKLASGGLQNRGPAAPCS